MGDYIAKPMRRAALAEIMKRHLLEIQQG